MRLAIDSAWKCGFICLLALRLSPPVGVLGADEARILRRHIEFIDGSGNVTVVYYPSNVSAGHGGGEAEPPLRPGYERLVVKLSCYWVVEARVSVTLLAQPAGDTLIFLRTFRACLADALGVDADDVKVRLSSAAELPPLGTSDLVLPFVVEVALRLPAGQALTKWWLAIRDMERWYVEDGRDNLAAALNASQISLGSRISTASRIHYQGDSCLADLDAHGAYSAMDSLANQTARSHLSAINDRLDLEPPRTSGKGNLNITLEFDLCASTDVAFLAIVQLRAPGRRLSANVSSANASNQSQLLKTSSPSAGRFAAVVATFLAVETQPYGALCLPETSRRTGHTLTRVGPHLVLFGGLAIEPGVDNAVPRSDLWIIRQGPGPSDIGWENMDTKHKIFIRPRARYGHLAASTSDGLFVIYGGHSGTQYLHDIWAIRIDYRSVDASKLQGEEDLFMPFEWRRCYSSEQRPTASLYASGVVIRPGQWIVFGGQQDFGALSNELWMMDLENIQPGKANFHQVLPYHSTMVPSPRVGHSVCWWPSQPSVALSRAASDGQKLLPSKGGGLLVFGGVELDFDDIHMKNDLWYYDVATNQWTLLEKGDDPLSDGDQPTATRPPPLVFHSAESLGSAMIIVGGVSLTTKQSADEGNNYEVRRDIWRWTDDIGWSIQFAPDSDDGSADFERFSAGAMTFWPAIGKVLVYGGQSDEHAWKAWEVQVLREQRKRKNNPYAQIMRYFPPLFSQDVGPASMLRRFFVVESEACPERLNETTGVPEDSLPVCLPCHSGSILARMSSNMSHTALEDLGAQLLDVRGAPWLANAMRCVPCRSGTIYSGGACVPCPHGFFSTFAGMDDWQMCQPCPAMTFASELGSTHCTPCPGPGPAPQDENISRATSHSLRTVSDTPAYQRCPMFARSSDEILGVQNVHEQNAPHAADKMGEHVFWQEVGLFVWASVLVTGFLLLVLIQARRPRAVAHFMKNFDMRPITAAPQPSEAGGVVFFGYVVTCACYSCVIIAQYYLYNTQLSSMSIPAEEDILRIRQIQVELHVNATLVGYTGPCTTADSERDLWTNGGGRSHDFGGASFADDADLPFRRVEATDTHIVHGGECHSLISADTNGLDAPIEKYCQRLDSRRCLVAFSCPQCGFHEAASFSVVVGEGYAFSAAREVHWSVYTAWENQDESGNPTDIHAFSSVQSNVTSGNLGLCMRGLEPSVVRLAMVPTDYKDTLTGTHLYGFVAQFIDARPGSTASAWSFHEAPATLASQVELHISHSVYKLVLSKKKSMLDFMAQVLAFLSGMSLIARVSLAAWRHLDEGSRTCVGCIWFNPVTRALSGVFCPCLPIEDFGQSEDEDEAGGYQQVVAPTLFRDGPSSPNSTIPRRFSGLRIDSQDTTALYTPSDPSDLSENYVGVVNRGV